MRTIHRLMIGAATAIVVPAFLFSQGPGGGGGFGGGGAPSPDRIWSFIDKTGKGYIDRSEIVDPIQKAMFDNFTQKMGITGDRVTKEDFTQGFEKMAAMRLNGGGRGGAGGADPDKFAEDKFKEYDRNGDGKLDYAELSERMKPLLAQYDTNKDGSIDLTEYKVYIKERFANTGGSSSGPAVVGRTVDPESPAIGSGAVGGTAVVEEEKRPTVFRVGKLPKELPGWFGQLDTDFDGQVGLYEWRKGQGTIEEFMEMDLDRDGLLTAEEVIRFYKLANEKTSKSDASLAGNRPPSAATGSGGRGGFGGGNPGGGFAPPVAAASPFGGGRGGPGGGGRGNRGPGNAEQSAPTTATPTTADAPANDRKDARMMGRPTRKN